MKTPEMFSRSWWTAKEDVHRAVFATMRAIEQEQASRRTLLKVCKALYGDERKPYTLFGSAPGVPLINPRRAAWGNISYNLCRVACDSLAAKIAKSKPKASFLTDGGTWSQRRRAHRLDAFVYGAFHESNLYRTARRVFLDGCTYDLGAVKGYVADGKICLERVMPGELRVGQLDGHYGKPRSLFHSTLVARDLALSWVDDWHQRRSLAERAEKKAAIKRSSSGLDQTSHWQALAELGDVVLVVESWHLPSFEGAKDGRHVVAVDQAVLLDEAWTAPRFPFAFFRFAERSEGFFGQGVVEMLMDRQRGLNSICRTIEDSLRLMSVPRYFSRTGAQFDVRQLTNEPGVIMTGLEPPQVLSGNVIPPELFTQYANVIREGLEQIGINQLSVAGRKPAGVNSAVALREQQDIESDRFSLVALAYEDFFTEAGQLIIDLARQANESGVTLRAAAPRKRGGLNRVDWESAAMDEGQYVLKIHSASSLPQTPAARKEFIRELFQDKLIDEVEYRRLMDLPDLEENGSLQAAARDDIDAVVEQFLDGDTDRGAEEAYEPPERFQDLNYGIKRMQLEYLRAKRQGAPPARLELLLRWVEQAQELLGQVGEPAQGAAPQGGQPAGPAAPAGAPPPMPPPAGPAPLPQAA